MITLYLDMDGVLADFDKEFHKNGRQEHDSQRFRDAVMNDSLFEKLDMMPDAHILLDHVAKIRGIRVEILTSLGTNNPFQSDEAKKQKLNWLRAHNIHYHANFVRSKPEKAKFASKTSILIDDSPGCVDPFVEKGGVGILHKDARSTISILDTKILQIKAMSL